MANMKDIFKKHFSKFKTSLKSCSYDKTNKAYICVDVQTEVYDFDKITLARNQNKQPSSFDALLINDVEVFCIEFKNQHLSEIDKYSIHKKIKDGFNTLKDIMHDYNIQRKNFNFVYCLVYRDEIANRHYSYYKNGIGRNVIKFDLSVHKKPDGEFDKIYTDSVSFFKKFNSKFRINC